MITEYNNLTKLLIKTLNEMKRTIFYSLIAIAIMGVFALASC